MNNLFPVGRTMYMLAITELALYSFVRGDWGMTRPRPLPEMLQGINPAMTYVSGALLLLTGASVPQNQRYVFIHIVAGWPPNQFIINKSKLNG